MDLASAPPSSETSGNRVIARGRRWQVVGISRSSDCSALRLHEIGRDRALTLLTPFDRLKAIHDNPRPRVVGARRWLHELDRALLQMHPFGSLRAAAQAPIRLLPYQLEPALAVLRDGAARLLIADGVGLGKTIQAGLLLLELARRHESCRTLVLAPAGLREQWLSELRTRFELNPVIADAAWLRSTSADRPAHVNPWSLPGIYIASHDLVKRPEVLRPLEDVTWDAVVIDEAHGAAPGTDRRRAMHAIALRSRHVLLLSATPHGGHPAALDALCRIGGDEPIVIFQRSRAEVGGGQPRKTTVLTVALSKAEQRMHHLLERYSRRIWCEAGERGDDRARLVSIVLRKRALSSAGSLSASVDRRLALLNECGSEDVWQLRLPLTSAQDEDPLEDDVPMAVLAVPGLADPRRERRWLKALAEVSRIAARDERKIAFLRRLLSRIREPAIVFTEYRDTLARLQQGLAAAGRPTVVLHGGLTPADRSSVQRAFNERGGTLLATDAASEGLNLHHRCRVVIHYELPWNPSRLEQRAGRVDRLGQSRRVHELALVAAHTAERLVLAPLFARLAGARHARTGDTRSRLLHALTESRVAAAVMTNTEPASAGIAPADRTPSCAVEPPSDLPVYASQEASRLEHHRQLTARSCDGHTPEAGGRAVLSRRDVHTGVSRGLFLVSALALLNADGFSVHAEPCLVRVDLRPHFFDRRGHVTSNRLKDAIAALMRPDGGFLISLLPQGDRDRLGALATLEERRRERQRQREQTIADAIAPGQPSAARLLVQAGLFDRRALRAAALHATSLAARREELAERARGFADSPPLALRIELVSALLVSDRPNWSAGPHRAGKR